MGVKNIKVCYGVDVDAVAGWLGACQPVHSHCDVSRGVYAVEVGIPNLLNFFKRHDIKATMFCPGQSIETFPDQHQQVVNEGHEIGLHGYAHENLIAMSPEQEEKVLIRTIEICKSLTGKKPVGYRAPWWELSVVTSELLVKHSFLYDSSLMHRDFGAYFVRTGDKWYSVDYNKDPDTWMRPMEFGQETDLIEIPANWYLDDLSPTTFITKHPHNAGRLFPQVGWVSPHVISSDTLFDMWKAQFDFLYDQGREGLFPITIHPETSGRPQMIKRLHERFVSYILGHAGVSFCTYEEYAKDWKAQHPRAKY